jgi:ADP-ribose diphosphatase
VTRKVDIHSQKRIFDDFFQIDEFHVAHEQLNGKMSRDQRRLVFERGDAVAALLLNLDSKTVVLVRQFKVPTLVGRRRDFKETTDGWITETIAGMIDGKETPEAAVIRETMEESGYQISNPRLIARFFSSPGGTSERIFQYFAEVRAADKTGPGGGIKNEDIEVIHMPLDELFVNLRRGLIEDPKLIAGASWLLDHLKSIEGLKSNTTGGAPPGPAPAGRGPLTLSTVTYGIKDHQHLVIGYKTGPITHIEDVDLWVNSENQDMMMDRFLGKSISANIRYLGAAKDQDGNVTEDTIEESLRTAVGQRPRVEIGTVLDTESGSLRTSHRVMRILHVASVKGVGFGQGVKAVRSDLAYCVKQVLNKTDDLNKRLWNRFRKTKYQSILIPMLGAGDGGLQVEEVAETIIPVAIEYFENHPTSVLEEIYFLAFTGRDKAACDQVLEQARLDRRLVR